MPAFMNSMQPAAFVTPEGVILHYTHVCVCCCVAVNILGWAATTKEKARMPLRAGTVRRVLRASLRQPKKKGGNLRLSMNPDVVRWAQKLLVMRIEFLLHEALQRAWSQGRKHVGIDDVIHTLQVQDTPDNRTAFLRLKFAPASK